VQPQKPLFYAVYQPNEQVAQNAGMVGTDGHIILFSVF